MPLGELATNRRIAGINSVQAALRTENVLKIFLSQEAEQSLLWDVVREAERLGVPMEWVGGSLQLGRACAMSRKTAVAAILKRKSN